MINQYAWSEGIQLFVRGRISELAAHRQQVTAIEILRRFQTQPGLILADEVGMGKTFVAMAVGVSTYLADSERRPVVVMMPSSIREKWMHDFETFKEACLTPDLQAKIKAKKAERSEEFLRALDDPEDRRPALIFMSHGAMSRRLTDSWVKWAMLRQSVKGRHNAQEIRSSLVKYGADIIELRSRTNKVADPEKLWWALLEKEPDEWVKVLKRHDALHIAFDEDEDNDELVPGSLLQIINELDTDKIYQELQLVLPKRDSTNLKDRLTKTRGALRGHLIDIWSRAVQRMNLSSPLLIMDEAHHLKNANTQIAKLFQTPESEDDARELEKGALANVFDRMLFLTATPFQLGHHELVGVLERFQGIRWNSGTGLQYSKEMYKVELAALSVRLDDAQTAALRLDKEWGKLSFDDAQLKSEKDNETWWTSLSKDENILTGADSEVVRAYNLTNQKMRLAEEILRRWVIRHNRPKLLDAPYAGVYRRIRIEGQGIVDNQINAGQGLNIEGEALLPFLLAARATAGSPETRPVFAEGLASSYEAFLDTRKQQDKHLGDALIDVEGDLHCPLAEEAELIYYMKKIEQALPRRGNIIEGSHPKVAATVNRAIEQWENGEKVLIFCHYIKTGQVLRQQIARQLMEKIDARAEQRLQCERGGAGRAFESIGNAIQKDSRGGIIDEIINGYLKDFALLSSDHKNNLSDITRRMLRTPAFLVRFFPLEKYKGEVSKELLIEAFTVRDASHMTYADVLYDFFDFLQNRCKESEREAYIHALKKIQTGTHYGKDVESAFDEEERMGDKEDLLPNVRLANGKVKLETRQRLMLTFNTPFYPEILIASSVMAEGVDLHMNCRFIVHHDLSWNPSSLEQRTGRVDRIGAKVEKCGQPIHVYYPYVAATQDEKMFRVVMDRERWFKVVMGEKYDFHSAEATERLVKRRPFPESAAEKLAFKLGVV